MLFESTNFMATTNSESRANGMWSKWRYTAEGFCRPGLYNVIDLQVSNLDAWITMAAEFAVARGFTILNFTGFPMVTSHYIYTNACNLNYVAILMF